MAGGLNVVSKYFTPGDEPDFEMGLNFALINVLLNCFHITNYTGRLSSFVISETLFHILN